MDDLKEALEAYRRTRDETILERMVEGPLCRAIISGILRHELSAGRRVHFRTSDGVATVKRRLRRFLRHGELRAETSEEFKALVRRTVRRAVYRYCERMDRMADAEREYVLSRVSEGADPWVEILEQSGRALGELAPEDRQVLQLHARGVPASAIGGLQGRTANAVHNKKWWIIRRLRTAWATRPPSR